MRWYKYLLDQVVVMLMIGIQRSDKNPTDEIEILSYFENIGYTHDDDYISNEHGKIGYLIMEAINYVVFREENSVGVFTHSVINYIRTLTEFDTVTVKEDEDDDDFIFIGNASEFITFWDEMGDEEE
tara:strand:- start:27 stop:407 length:381 start_codon:yes stop_codon:yes gene_type:complete